VLISPCLRVYSVCHEQGSKILTASWINKDALQLWDYSHGRLIKNIPYRSHATRADGSDCQSRGDYASGESECHEHIAGEYLYCAQFCTDDVVIAGGTGTNSVQSINVNTGKVYQWYYISTVLYLNCPISQFSTILYLVKCFVMHGLNCEKSND